MIIKKLFITVTVATLIFSCSHESQNSISRSIQNWTGTDGVLDVYAGEKLVHRFIEVDKLSTGEGTTNKIVRPYRYGYGVDDLNFNGKKDKGEKKVYFEFSDYSTSYIFYERK